ncbi:histidine phosphotransferase [Alphaproteobacteria bacterium GH1-50]|uniref:Histidine phosphotransferase n=1 Tax=Kangsaoukella pontilimi TaxID=2691042 RepID=A0A7C9MFQ3_9RHOB|nr:histidine phosphotransferase family protein [Kangsaoukella pontilimi]MXQ07816.1 histidine phosphotransferase [Kangsaoukella pontilimi]
MSGIDLNALIGSRICHDLISPLGAIGNGVELLQMSGQAQGPELALISESVENANARIRFFRVAFGAASAEASMARSEIMGILDATYRSGRVSVRWTLDGDRPRRDVKLAYLAIQCVEGYLPRGGTITVSETGNAWRVSGHGERLRDDQMLWELARGRAMPERLPASDVHFALLPLAAGDAGRSLSVALGEDTVTVSF